MEVIRKYHIANISKELLYGSRYRLDIDEIYSRRIAINFR